MAGGTTIELSGGVRGYLAAPEQGAGPGLLVIQDRWGRSPFVEAVCDRFALEGFAALAPDLIAGAPATAPDDADRLMIGLNLDQAARRLGASVDHLTASPSVRGEGIGAVGFGMGGGLALVLATQRPSDVRAGVVFHGLAPSTSDRPDWSSLRAPVQGHFGEDDDRCRPEEVRRLEVALSEPGNDVELFLYPGAGHAFFDDTRPEAYHGASAALAWIRTLEFLRAKLG